MFQSQGRRYIQNLSLPSWKIAMFVLLYLEPIIHMPALNAAWTFSPTNFFSFCILSSL